MAFRFPAFHAAPEDDLLSAADHDPLQGTAVRHALRHGRGVFGHSIKVPGLIVPDKAYGIIRHNGKGSLRAVKLSGPDRIFSLLTWQKELIAVRITFSERCHAIKDRKDGKHGNKDRQHDLSFSV